MFSENAPSREFYSRHSFDLQSEDGEGSFWTFDLNRRVIVCPDWIKVMS